MALEKEIKKIKANSKFIYSLFKNKEIEIDNQELFMTCLWIVNEIRYDLHLSDVKVNKLSKYIAIQVMKDRSKK